MTKTALGSLALIVALTNAALATTSENCEPADSTTNSSREIVGNWYNKAESDSHTLEIVMVFHANGKFTWLIADTPTGGKQELERKQGSYSIKGNKLILKYDDREEVLPFALKGDVIKFKDNEGEVFLALTRVSDR